MKLGTFMMPLHPPEKPRTRCFEEDTEFLIRADSLGFTEGWVGQHHTVAWEPIPANDIFLAHAFAQTSNIRLGTGVSILPQHHPANVAVRLAFLDHLSHGRLNCGFGQGGAPTDHELFNLPDPKTQGLMTLEAMDLILRLWQCEAPFDFQGQFWRVRIENPVPELGIGCLLKPFQNPHPPIAMSIIKGQSMAAQFAGSRGYIPVSTNLVATPTLIEHWATYCRGAEQAGRPEPSRSSWRISRSIFVADTTAEAVDHALQGTFGASFTYMITLLKATNMLNIMKHDPAVPDSEVTPEYLLKHLCIVGSVSDCISQLEDLWQQTGGFGTLLMIAHDWDDKKRWLDCMDLLVKEVVPALPEIDPGMPS